MTPRPHLALDPAQAPRPSAKVSSVAELLDCDPGDVRRLVRAGELEGFTIGKRGIRIYLDAVRAYQDRQNRVRAERAAVIHKPRPRSSASTAAYRAALAGLAAKGLL